MRPAIGDHLAEGGATGLLGRLHVYRFLRGRQALRRRVFLEELQLRGDRDALLLDFDPTNSIVGNRTLIRVAVAWAPEYVLPLWRTYFGSPGAFIGMDVGVSVSEAAEPS